METRSLPAFARSYPRHSPVRLVPFYACRAVVFAKAGRSSRLAPFMLSVFNEFPSKSDSQFLRQCDGKILQTRNS